MEELRDAGAARDLARVVKVSDNFGDKLRGQVDKRHLRARVSRVG
jgi:hypothetical protein